MREATTRVVDLSVDEGTAHAFLDYLYFDELDVTSPTSPDLCCHLLKLAHQYEVQSLVDRCTAVLESGLDVAASIERLMLADELGLGKLRAACVNFYVFSNSEFLLTLFSFPSSFLSKIIF